MNLTKLAKSLLPLGFTVFTFSAEGSQLYKFSFESGSEVAQVAQGQTNKVSITITPVSDPHDPSKPLFNLADNPTFTIFSKPKNFAAKIVGPAETRKNQYTNVIQLSGLHSKSEEELSFKFCGRGDGLGGCQVINGKIQVIDPYISFAPSQKHLQYRAVGIVVMGSSLVLSPPVISSQSPLYGKVQICSAPGEKNSENECPKIYRTTCDFKQTIYSGYRCNIWFRSLDSKTLSSVEDTIKLITNNADGSGEKEYPLHINYTMNLFVGSTLSGSENNIEVQSNHNDCLFRLTSPTDEKNLRLTDGRHACSVSALTLFQGDLMAGGIFSHLNSTDTQSLARWNGDNWLSVPGITAGEVKALLTVDTSSEDTLQNLYVTGSNLKFLNSDVNNIALFNWYFSKSNWTISPLGGGLKGNGLALAVLPDASGQENIYVGGDFTEVGDPAIPARYLAVWKINGTSPTEGKWEALGGTQDKDGNPLIQTVNSSDLPIYTLLGYNNKLYVGGNFKIQFSDGSPGPVKFFSVWDPTYFFHALTGAQLTNQQRDIPYTVRTLSLSENKENPVLLIGGLFDHLTISAKENVYQTITIPASEKIDQNIRPIVLTATALSDSYYIGGYFHAWPDATKSKFDYLAEVKPSTANSEMDWSSTSIPKDVIKDSVQVTLPASSLTIEVR